MVSWPSRIGATIARRRIPGSMPALSPGRVGDGAVAWWSVDSS